MPTRNHPHSSVRPGALRYEAKQARLCGGVEIFGIVGLILGPVLVTLSLAVLRTYQESVSAR